MSTIYKIINFNAEEYISNTWKHHWSEIKLFLLIFVLNVFIYGQRMFFHILANDDLLRFNGAPEKIVQAVTNGRWLNEVLNLYVFKGAFHILPYFNFLVGLFAITLAGFFTARVYFKEQHTFRIVLISLICTVSPFFAQQFFHNTNMTAWIFTPIGIYGIWLLKKTSWGMRLLGMVLFSLAIGTYQVAFQIGIILVFFDTILLLLKTKNHQELVAIFRQFVLMMTMLLVGFFLYILANYIYAKLFSPPEIVLGSYILAKQPDDKLAGLLAGIIRTYRFSPLYVYFERLFNYLIYIAFFLPLLYVYPLIKKNHSFTGDFRPTAVWLNFLGILFLITLLPLVIGLPKLVNFNIEVHSYYHVSWAMAGLYLMTIKCPGWIKNLFRLNLLVFLVFSIMYINVLFYGAGRQTARDEIYVNDITTQIRLHPNYSDEQTPLSFRIEGAITYHYATPFTVPGFTWYANQGLSCYWCMYNVFKNLSSFNFTRMDDPTYAEMEEYIMNETITDARKKNIAPEISAYPAKNSLWVKDGKVVLFLNPEKINQKLKLGCNNIYI